MRRIVKLLVTASVTLAACGPALATADLTKLRKAVGDMSELDLVVFGKATVSSEVEGKAFIGGDLVSNGWNVGLGGSGGMSSANKWGVLTVGGNVSGNTVNVLNGNSKNGSISGSTSTVTIQGNASGINVANAANNSTISMAVGGSMALGGSDFKVGQGSTLKVHGSVSGGKLYVSGGSTTVDGSVTDLQSDRSGSSINIGGTASGNLDLTAGTVNFKGNAPSGAYGKGATINSNVSTMTAAGVPDVTSQTSSLVDEFKYLATGASQISQNAKAITSNAVLSRSDFGINSDGSFNKNFVVFNVSDAKSFFTSNNNSTDLASTLQNIGGQTVIFNIAGTAIDQSINFNTLAGSSKIIWNFYQATSLNLTGFQGTVLAPFATVSNSSAINGSVIANVFNQGGEVHLGTFDGDTSFLNAISSADPYTAQTAVPEPATWAMMVIGFGAVGSTIRRRKGKPGFASAI